MKNLIITILVAFAIGVLSNLLARRLGFDDTSAWQYWSIFIAMLGCYIAGRIVQIVVEPRVE